MKKFLKWTGISLVLIIALLIAAPFIFKDKIIAFAKKYANEQLNATLDFGAFDLTFIRSFPDFRLQIDDISVVGKEEFANDTLAKIDRINIDLNLMSVIKGGPYQVNSIEIDHPVANVIVLEDGKANYDIVKPSTDTVKTEESKEPMAFSLKLKKFQIKNAVISYDDKVNKMYAFLDTLNFNLKGDFTQDVFDAKTLLEIERTTFKMSGMNYLSKAKIRFDSEAEIDLPNSKYTFKENEFDINALGLMFDGFVATPGNDMNMDIKLSTRKADFKTILSLIPAIYKKDFDGLEAKGNVQLGGYAKGTYNKTTYPAFALNLLVENGMFKYPALPKSVNNVQIKLDIENKTGMLDATTIDLEKLHVEMAGNPIDARAFVKTPISDPQFDIKVVGTVDLASVKEFIPIEKEDQMQGTVKADVAMNGRLSYVEKKQYENFKAQGYIQAKNLLYASKDLPQTTVSEMVLNFSNQYVELANLDAKIGNSDAKANGRIENFLQYIFRGELLKGNFNLSSNTLDLNQFMKNSTSENTTAQATTDTAKTSTGVIAVPANIDFELKTRVNRLLFQNFTFSNIVGDVVVRDQKVNLSDLQLNGLGGKVVADGYYESRNIKRPTVKLNFKLTDLDIQETYKNVESIRKMVPILEQASGKFNASIENFTGALDENMSPDLNSINLKGNVRTAQIQIKAFEAFKKMADALKIEKLKNLSLYNLNFNYAVYDGRMFINPFDVKIDKINANISGSTGLDQTIDYAWKMTVPTEYMGTQANSVVTGLLGKANQAVGTNFSMPKTIDVVVKFGGTVKKPTVSTDLKNMAKSAAEDIKEEVVTVVKEKVSEEAKKILEEAQKQVDKIKQETNALIEKTRKEGYAAADKLVAEAKNPIAKLAAEKAAAEAKKKVDQEIAKIQKDADARSQKILDDAKKKADSIK